MTKKDDDFPELPELPEDSEDASEENPIEGPEDSFETSFDSFDPSTFDFSGLENTTDELPAIPEPAPELVIATYPYVAPGVITSKMQALIQHKKDEIAERERLAAMPKQPYRREEPRVGRNDPCPCGSGKKYKKCHMGKDLEEEESE